MSVRPWHKQPQPEATEQSGALVIALEYIGRGWSPIPIPFREKGPKLQKWQHLRITRETAANYFNGAPQNIGVLLGPASAGLTDIDLDCAEALAVASYLLPPTKAIFGRASCPASHRIYVTDAAQNIENAVINFDDPTLGKSDGVKSRIVEFRAGGGEKGAQTVFPGSTHESGEAIRWDSNESPIQVDAAQLLSATKEVAAAALLAKHWPDVGKRHDAAKAIGGFLARAGWNVPEIGLFAEAVAVAAGDTERKDRIQAARNQAEAFQASKNTFGYPKLKELFGEKVARCIADWLGYQFRSEEQAAASEHEAPRADVSLLRAAAEVEQQMVQWIWLNRFARGKLTLLGGDPGTGKSQTVIDVIARITTGAPWPDGGTAPLGNCVILSAEDAANDTICPRLEAAGADLSRVYILEAVREQNGRKRSFNLQSDLDSLARAITDIGGASFVMIDPVTAYMGETDSHKTADVRAVLEAVDAFSQANGTAIAAITHPPKAAQAKAINAFTGSLAYVAAARLAFIAVEEAEDGEATGRVLLLCVKNNIGPKPDGMAFRLSPTVTPKGISTCRIVWDNAPVTVTATEAVSGSPCRGKSAQQEAEEWLLGYLADRPMPVAAVIEAAEAMFIAERTLRRAAKVIGVVSEKQGYADGWVWRLVTTGFCGLA